MAKANILVRTRLKKARELISQQRLAEAAGILRQLGKKNRDVFEVWQLLADTALRMNDLPQSIDFRKQALSIVPGHTESWLGLARTLRRAGSVDEAINAYEKAFANSRNDRSIYTELIDVYIAARRLDRAEELLHGLIAGNDRSAELHSAMGVVKHMQGNLVRAIECHRSALALDASNPMFFVNLAAALCINGQTSESLGVYRDGQQRFPGHKHLRSGYLLGLLYPHDITDEEVHAAHISLMEHGDGTVSERPRTTADPDRRLRVGYVSPDIREHSVAYFIGPVIEAHDRRGFEVVCYSDTASPDRMTSEISRRADKWRDTSGLDDRQFSRLVLNDGIDILVDLAGHTAGNRLESFAQRPAPVQVTYLGYPDTTGLREMDYRITDGVSDPHGYDEHYIEELVRLPGCFLCYRPPSDAPEPGARPPSADAGLVTFGSFNNLAKINDATLDLWSGLLRKLPQARLLIKNPSLGDETTRDLLLARFRDRGVASERAGSVPAGR